MSKNDVGDVGDGVSAVGAGHDACNCSRMRDTNVDGSWLVDGCGGGSCCSGEDGDSSRLAFELVF